MPTLPERQEIDLPLASRPDGDDATHLAVSIYHRKAGMSYYDYKQYPAGVVMSITPTKIGDRMRFCTLMGGRNSATYLDESPRLDRKRLARYAAELKAGVGGTAGFLANFCATRGYTLAQPVAEVA